MNEGNMEPDPRNAASLPKLICPMSKSLDAYAMPLDTAVVSEPTTPWVGNLL
jgi:hypothetical protein